MNNFTFYSTEYYSEEYIVTLIKNKIQENLYLDYKRELKLEGSEERKEFLYDISSFANSEGGIIIFGIDEDRNTGLPSEIIGIPAPNVDSLIQKIESIIESSIKPRITNIAIKIIEISGKIILTIIIPKSLGMPHMVTFRSTNKFYKRRNSGKYLVDIYELNRMFMQNNELQEKSNKFVYDRITSLQKNELNPNFLIRNSTLVHIVPLSFSQNHNQIPLTKRDDYQKIFDSFIGLMTYSQRHHNFDGYIMYYFSPEYKKITCFLQIFRNGVIELFSDIYCGKAGPNDDRLLFFADNFEEDCIEFVTKAINFYKEMDLFDPLLIYINLLEQTNVRLYSQSRFRFPEPIGRDHIKIPPVLFKNYEEDITKILKPAFDVIWQSSGIEKSINYNDLGERILKK